MSLKIKEKKINNLVLSVTAATIYQGFDLGMFHLALTKSGDSLKLTCKIRTSLIVGRGLTQPTSCAISGKGIKPSGRVQNLEEWNSMAAQ